MPQASSQPPGIFICYRRDDSAGHAIHLFHYLRDHLKRGQIFMDIDIEPGEQFAQKIEREVGSCEIFIALIGKQWLAVRGDAGRRLDDPEDFVRLEVATALARGITVIPVLVDGAQIPLRHDLPANMAGLPDHQSCQLSNQDWNHDADRLVRLIKGKLAERREAHRLKKSEPSLPASALAKRKRLAAAGLAAFMTVAGALLLPYLWKTGGGQPEAESTAGAQLNPAVGGDGSAGLRDRGQGSGRLKDKEFENAFGMKFVWVPPGKFMMGSENGFTDERPVRRVTINSGFYMAKYEVTQAQWWVVMGKGSNPSSLKGENLPVEKVSLEDTRRFVEKLNGMDGNYLYRLPTEAEWEYAARAGTTGDYAGDLGSMAWYEVNQVASSHPVGRRQANDFGLHDMQGNVQEWVQDSYHTSYEGAPTDGSAWLAGGEQGYGVVRGGSSYSPANFCRPATRVQVELGSHADRIGFRVVASVRQ